jgi:hypothetical protein
MKTFELILRIGIIIGILAIGIIMLTDPTAYGQQQPAAPVPQPDLSNQKSKIAIDVVKLDAKIDYNSQLRNSLSVDEQRRKLIADIAAINEKIKKNKKKPAPEPPKEK